MNVFIVGQVLQRALRAITGYHGTVAFEGRGVSASKNVLKYITNIYTVQLYMTIICTFLSKRVRVALVFQRGTRDRRQEDGSIFVYGMCLLKKFKVCLIILMAIM